MSYDGTELSINSENADDIITILNIEEALKILKLPNTLYKNMLKTNPSAGRQTEIYDNYKVSWSYHPDYGLDVWISIINKQ